MRVTLVGPGRLGALLATSASRAAHRLVAVAGGSPAARDQVVRLVAGARPYPEVAEAARGAELVLLAVPDDAIEEVVRELVLADAVVEGQRVVHVSGARGLEPLRLAALAGARTAACHPCVTVPSGTSDPEHLVGVSWAVTAGPSDLGWATELVTSLGGDAEVVHDDRRALYHAGLTLGANASGAAVVAARQLLLASGIRDVPRFLGGLVRDSVANAAASGGGGLTGPVVRGDAGTVTEHLSAIERDLPELAEVYRSLLTGIVSLVGLPAFRENIRADRLDEVRRALSRPTSPEGDPRVRAATPRVVRTVAEVRRAVDAAHRRGERVALVPTMGALHQGHLSLVRLAAERADLVVVSVFVNPTQFDRRDDLEAYPRDLEGDLEQLAELGEEAPDLVFAPDPAEMYPGTSATTVHVGDDLAARLEGASRPGHFDGVATVVTKLFGIARPDLALFGRKDAQQGHVVRRLVADLNLPVEILMAPTVRESGGIALSSRNRRLSPAQRRAALGLSRALAAAVLAARRIRAGARHPSVAEVRVAARATLARTEGLGIDYLEVVDPASLEALDDEARPDRVLVVVAGVVGEIRLIDNVEVGDPADEERLLDATGVGVPPTRPVGTGDAGTTRSQ